MKPRVFKSIEFPDAYVVEINGNAYDMDSRATDPNGVCMYAGEMDDIIRAYVGENCREISLTMAPVKVLAQIIELLQRELEEWL